MNTSENSQRIPSEGDRLGGTLAEGRLASRSRADRQAGSQQLSSSLNAPRSGGEAPTRDRSRPNDGADGLANGISALHFDHRVWLNSLRFYREELFIFQRHLEQFVRTAAVPETMAHVEQFQNRFIRQSEVIDELAHDIKKHDQALSDQLSSKAPGMIYRPFGIHNELRERMDTFERLYMELKNEFRNWLAYNR